jgi:hypothetical protein
MCKFLFFQIYFKVDFFDQKYKEYQKFMMSKKNGPILIVKRGIKNVDVLPTSLVLSYKI